MIKDNYIKNVLLKLEGAQLYSHYYGECKSCPLHNKRIQNKLGYSFDYGCPSMQRIAEKYLNNKTYFEQETHNRIMFKTKCYEKIMCALALYIIDSETPEILTRKET